MCCTQLTSCFTVLIRHRLFGVSYTNWTVVYMYVCVFVFTVECFRWSRYRRSTRTDSKLCKHTNNLQVCTLWFWASRLSLCNYQFSYHCCLVTLSLHALYRLLIYSVLTCISVSLRLLFLINLSWVELIGRHIAVTENKALQSTQVLYKSNSSCLQKLNLCELLTLFVIRTTHQSVVTAH